MITSSTINSYMMFIPTAIPTTQEIYGSSPMNPKRKTCQNINNVSEDVMRMINTAINHLLPETGTQRDLNICPVDLQP